ncbi:uncharacterized protein LOC131692086 [Topomyia yanbarensis]|uniref:uncharacterized protein LOC131692086 n=1 Tax=Topomyia yanbarensis TaxID=2498891 RepID=UPI00273B7EFF|nr:uncharacterized protein LOC131692086 [Topomyia yanbarensis]
MGSSTISLLTVVMVLCISMWTTVVSSPVAISDVQQSTVDVARHLQRRSIVFRPLFVYREQEIKKKRIQEAREQKQINQQEYERQMQDYDRQMQEYDRQMQEYEKQMQEYKRKHGNRNK